MIESPRRRFYPNVSEIPRRGHRVDLPGIDLLQVDAEGYDAEILRLFDIPRRKPAIIQFEHKHLGRRDVEACLNLLIDEGYKISICGSDTLAYNPRR